jgi:hypothetical protein
MNWEGYERKRLWPNLRRCSSICLEGLRIATKHISQDRRSPGRDLIPGLPRLRSMSTNHSASTFGIFLVIVIKY